MQKANGGLKKKLLQIPLVDANMQKKSQNDSYTCTKKMIIHLPIKERKTTNKIVDDASFEMLFYENNRHPQTRTIA